MSQFNISPEEVSKLEEKFEIKSNERKLKNFLKLLTFIALVTMSIYHFYASGFGTIRDILHRGIHISFVVGLVFLFYNWKSFPENKSKQSPFNRYFFFNSSCNNCTLSTFIAS
jgi:TRAP-type uncharacterized transport system fused permease subunit